MKTIEQKIVATQNPTLKDFVTFAGWERLRYRKAVQDLNAVIASHALSILESGEEWTPVVDRKSHRERIGPASLVLSARHHDGKLELQLDHRGEYYVDYRGGFFELTHRTTVITLNNGVIESIKTGKENRDDYRMGAPEYLQLGTKEWKDFQPDIKSAETLAEQTEALHNTVMSLKEAEGSHPDVSLVY